LEREREKVRMTDSYIGANVYHYVIVKQAVLALAVKNDKSGLLLISHKLKGELTFSLFSLRHENKLHFRFRDIICPVKCHWV
jgi:hypothetical protein